MERGISGMGGKDIQRKFDRRGVVNGWGLWKIVCEHHTEQK